MQRSGFQRRKYGVGYGRWFVVVPGDEASRTSPFVVLRESAPTTVRALDAGVLFAWRAVLWTTVLEVLMVRRTRKNLEVRRNVVELVPVDVVNHLARSQSSPELCFCDNTVLVCVATYVR
jgi:hypothetical protein